MLLTTSQRERVQHVQQPGSGVQSVAPRDAGTLAPLLWLAWPVLIEQLLAMLLGFSDTWLVGHYLDPAHLAAMTSLAYMLWLLPNLCSLVSIGATAMVARFTGAGDLAAANHATHQAFIAGGVLAVVTTCVGFALGDFVLGSMQLEGESLRLATRFLHFVLPVMPFMMLEIVGIACLRGAGDTVTGLVTMVLVNLVGVSASWILMLGLGPFPAYGWDGVAIGTAGGHVIGGLVPLVQLLRGRAGLRLQWRSLRPDPVMIRRLLNIGVPGGLDIILIISCQIVFLSLVNRLGEVASAAHGVAIRLESIGYLPGLALQVAATTLAGQYLGMRDSRRATRVVITACIAGGALMSSAGLLMYFGADQLVHLFLGTGQIGVPAVAAPLLRTISTAMFPLAILMIVSGALRGAGDTRWPLVISLVGFLGIRMPVAYLLAYVLGWGVQGAWYAMVIDVYVRAVLVTWRFAGGKWRQIAV